MPERQDERSPDKASNQPEAQRRTQIQSALWLFAIVISIVLAGGIIAALPKKNRSDERARIGNPNVGKMPGNVGRGTPLVPTGAHQLAVFAQGCFWGVEERFRKMPGVVATAVGYTGGRTEHPVYQDVSTGTTGHVEAVLVEFDPDRLRYDDLLRFFWRTHDPTSGDAQGPDRGSQYRSAIYTFGPEQMRIALASRGEEQKDLADPITTEIAAVGPFWLAEAEHQQRDEKRGILTCPVPQRARRK
jgi:peptide-methionine (S)-S-oxide reductase